MHDPTISVEGNRFLFTGFHPQGDWEHFCSDPCSPMRPSTSLAPHQGVSQKHAQKFPISLCVLQPSTQTVLHLLWKAHSWGSESPSSCISSLLQDLGYVVPRKYVPCYIGSWWSPGGHRSQESGFSVCPSEKQKSTLLVTVWFQIISHESMLGYVGRFPQSSISFAGSTQFCQLSPCTLSSACTAAFTTPGHMAEY